MLEKRKLGMKRKQNMKKEIQDFENNYKKNIQFENVAIDYYRLGDSAKSIVFFQGGLKKSKIAHASLEILSKRFSVISVDYPPTYDIRFLVAAIEAVMDAENIQTFAVVGQSYGGTIAQAFLQLSDRKPESVFIFNSGPLLVSTFSQILLLAIFWFMQTVSTNIVKAFFYRSLSAVLKTKPDDQREFDKEVKSIIRNELSKRDILSFFKVLYSYGKIEKYHGRKDVKVPVYIYASENDSTQSTSDRTRYKKLFPNSEWTLLYNQVHSMYIENPSFFCRLIEEKLPV